MRIVKYLPLLAALAALAGCDPGRMEAERAVKSQLIDPGSAQFQNTFFVPATGAYCGHVNARNRYGGYTGDRLFAVKDGVAVLMPLVEEVQARQREAETLMRIARSTLSERDLEKAGEALRQAEEASDLGVEHATLVIQWCGD